MTGVIVAIIVGFIIAMIEKSMSKGGRESAEASRPRSREMRAVPMRESRKAAAAPPPAPSSGTKPAPFLHADEEGARVTADHQAPQMSPATPAFTRGQRELRRAIILGEILRRKF